MLVEPNLLVSSSVIFGTVCLSVLLREILVKIIPAKNPLLLRSLLEFVASFELMAAVYERGVFGSVYGTVGLSTSLFLLSIWRSFYWKNVRVCPYVILEEWITKRIDGISALVLVTSELAGGFVVYQTYSKYIWSFGFSSAHVARLAAGDSCSWPLKVDYTEAALYEAGYAFLFGLTCRFLANVLTNSNLIPVLKASVFTYLIMSGGIFNPLLAAVLQTGCSGITLFQHIVIYWVGASAGAICSYFVWKVLYTDRRTGTASAVPKKKKSKQS